MALCIALWLSINIIHKKQKDFFQYAQDCFQCSFLFFVTFSVGMQYILKHLISMQNEFGTQLRFGLCIIQNDLVFRLFKGSFITLKLVPLDWLLLHFVKILYSHCMHTHRPLYQIHHASTGLDSFCVWNCLDSWCHRCSKVLETSLRDFWSILT